MNAEILELERPGRRNFLRLLTIGSGVLVAGGVLDRLNNLKSSKPVSSKTFSGFRVTESKKEVTFSNNSGDELLIIEKNT